MKKINPPNYNETFKTITLFVTRRSKPYGHIMLQACVNILPNKSLEI